MVQVIEVEHLKACPFCGGRAELLTDKHPMNGEYNIYRVRCTGCGILGNMFLDGRTMAFGDTPSRYVSPKEAQKMAVSAWNMRYGRKAHVVIDMAEKAQSKKCGKVGGNNAIPTN